MRGARALGAPETWVASALAWMRGHGGRPVLLRPFAGRIAVGLFERVQHGRLRGLASGSSAQRLPMARTRRARRTRILGPAKKTNAPSYSLNTLVLAIIAAADCRFLTRRFAN